MNRADLLLELKAQITRHEYSSLGLVNLNYLRLEVDRELDKEGKVAIRRGRKMRLKW